MQNFHAHVIPIKVTEAFKDLVDEKLLKKSFTRSSLIHGWDI